MNRASATGCFASPDDKDRCSHPIDRTHSEIVKYARDDDVEREILPVLVKFADRALARRLIPLAETNNMVSPPAMHSSPSAIETGDSATAKKKQRLKLLQRLRASCPYEDRKDQNPKRAEGTCEWFTSHPCFQDWLEQDSALLWASADPGCGKSVLSRYLVDGVLPRDDRIVCYFFFKDGLDDQQALSVALCSILHQLFRQDPATLSDAVLEIVEEDGDFLFRSARSLFRLLLDAVQSCAKDVVCVFDALDECADPTPLTDELGKMFTKGEKPDGLKLIITSRPYKSIRKGLMSLPTIHLSGESEEEAESISKEITIVIEHRVRELVRFRDLSDGQEQALRNVFAKTVERTYLWVDLMFKSLELVSLLHGDALLDAINTLPLSVEEAYSKILSKSGEPEKVLKVLQIVAAAARPLHLREIAVALALDDREHHDYPSLMESVTVEHQLQQEIRDLCGFFVVITKGHLHLLHQTAREFLVATKGSVVPRWEWQYSVNLDDANKVLAYCCMRLLQLLSLEERVSTRNPMAMRHERVFVAYAMDFWPDHYRQIEENVLDEMAVMVKELCYFPRWIDGRTHGYSVVHQLNALNFACFVGVNSVVLVLLAEMDFNLQHPGFGACNGLELASQQGHAVVVNTLLQLHPSNKDSTCRSLQASKRKALFLAIENGHYHIVELLLKAGTPADFVERRNNNTPLAIAAKHGNEAILELLIRHGAQAGTTCFTPLTNAAVRADCLQLQLLLQQGSPIDALDAAGETALLRATKADHYGAAELLLKNNASTEIVDLEGRTALICAVELGSSRFVELLLEHNANINSDGYTKRNVIVRAAETGRTDMLELLLARYLGREELGECRDLAFWAAKDAGTAELCIKHGTSPNMKNVWGVIALGFFASKGNREIVELLLDHGAHVDGDVSSGADETDSRLSSSCYDRPPILDAAEAEMTDVLTLLIKRGANIEARDPRGTTALMVAAEDANEDALRVLLDYGAQTEARDVSGCTALLWAVSRRWLPAESTVQMVQLLLTRGAQVDAMDIAKRTALHRAVGHDYCDGKVAALLLQHGAHIEARDGAGRTPLTVAAALGYISSVRVLLANGAQVAAEDSNGHTALWWADLYSRKKKKRGDRHNHEDIKGTTELLCRQDYADVIQALTAAGALESMPIKFRLRYRLGHIW